MVRGTSARRLGGLLLALTIGSCAEPAPAPRERDPARSSSSPSDGGGYAFVVAGHTYGDPSGSKEARLHPPFLAALEELAALPRMAFLVLTGDVVRYPRTSYWNLVDEELAERWGLPFHVAVGGHDIGYAPRSEPHPERLDLAAWEARYGPTYGAFHHGGDCFVRLDANRERWSITGEQLAMLDRELAACAEARNVFVFVHQVIWLDLDDPERTLRPNSFGGWSPDINFASEVEPRLRALGRPVYLFAGDLGATAESEPLWYRRDGDLHLIGSGMGSGEGDHVIVVDVSAEGRVELNVRALGAGFTGRLEDHPANRR